MDKIIGLHIYYYNVCKRKLWYFLRECHMEEDNELVAEGKLIDESSYTRNEKHIDVLGYANIDAIHDNVIRETKKSKSLENASVWQIKYYLYILKKYGMDDIRGELCYPKLKEKTDVILNAEDIAEIEKMSQEIEGIYSSEIPPQEIKIKSICKKCAYYDLCKI